MNFAKLFELETKSGRRCEATQTIVKFLGNDEHGRPQHALRFLKIPMLNGKPINPQAPWMVFGSTRNRNRHGMRVA